MVQCVYKVRGMEYRYNDSGLNGHEVSRSDVNEVLAVYNPTTRDFDLPMSKGDNLRIMFVGYNFAGRLLEVGVEFISEGESYVFHAQTVSPQYRKVYEERIAHE